MKYKLAERFVSINGEGKWAGELAVFLRFSGCNLKCSYCDTMWANDKDCKTTEYEVEEILEYIKKSGAKHVTITGGEPLLQEKIEELMCKIYTSGAQIEIETNGSVNLRRFARIVPKACFTMDYKMPSSGMESSMDLENLKILRSHDTLKMVCGSIEDLEVAREIAKIVGEEVQIFISPVFGQIESKDIVEYIIKNKLKNMRFQLQLHKYIWDKDERGV